MRVVRRLHSMVVLLACTLDGATGSDRIVEFSARTLPRMDQLTHAAVPTILRGITNAPSWVLSSADHTLRPSNSPTLCLDTLGSQAVGDGIALWTCQNSSLNYNQQWLWNGEHLSPKRLPQLCVSATAIGIVHTLSLQRCEISPVSSINIAWTFTSGGALITNGEALFPDTAHSGVRDLVDRLAPVFSGGGHEGDQVRYK